MQTLVEIGPCNASQGHHRSKDATEQMKNLTLARARTQVLGFSSADALPSKLRVPVGRTWIFIPIGFRILNSLRCLPITWSFTIDMLFLSVFAFFIIVHCWLHYISKQFTFIYVVFQSTLVNMQTLFEIVPSNASQGQHRRKDATEQMKYMTLARTRTQFLGFSSVDALPLTYGCQWAEPEFLSLKAIRS